MRGQIGLSRIALKLLTWAWHIGILRTGSYG